MRDLAAALYGGTPPAPAPAPLGSEAPVVSTASPAPARTPAATPAPAAVPPATPGPDAPVSPVQAPKAAPAPSAQPLTVDAIAAGVPEDVRQQRAEASRKLYGGDAELAKAMPNEMFKGSGQPPEVESALAAEVRAIAGDLGLVPTDVAPIRAALAAEQASPSSEDQRTANRETIVEALNKQYGQGARQVWLDARKFVAQDPRRAALLAPVGDDPSTVLRIVQLAQAAKSAGRLR